MRDYGKVYSTFWTSQTTGRLSDTGRVLALYLLSCNHSTSAGVFRLPDGYVCEDLGWPSERVSEGFAELFRNGFANRCGTTQWVWIRKHFEFNAPENPNQRKAARKIALSVPDECCWRPDFLRTCGDLLEIDVAAELNRSETLSKPFRNQEQEQEQKQERKDGLPSASLQVVGAQTGEAGSEPPAGPNPPAEEDPDAEMPPGVPPCPHTAIRQLWGEVLPQLPQHRIWTKTRAEHLRARWRETAVSRGWTDQQQGLAYFRRLFAHVGKSRFLTGNAPPSRAGQPPFVCELEWLLLPSNWAKVIEGKYHQEAA